MKLTKKFCLSMVLAMLLPLLSVQPPVVSAELTHQELALDFLGDVVGLDLSRYEVDLKWYSDYSSYSNRIYDADATYDLVSDESQMVAKFFFKHNGFICDISDLKGPMLLTHLAADALDAAKSFMNRYQGFAGGQYLQPLRAMLQNVTDLKNVTSTVGELRFEVEPSPVGANFLSFQWMYNPNGIYNRFAKISLMFEDGVFLHFSDVWNSYVVGGSEVNVSQEQAIGLAKEHIAAYSYVFGNKTIGNLTVGDTDVWVSTNLSMQVKKDNRLYPCWELLIPLAKVYPGFVTAMHVYLWADTGELSLIEKSSGGGISGASDDASVLSGEETTPTTSQVENQAPSIPTPALVAVAIPLSLAAIIAALAINKKRKK